MLTLTEVATEHCCDEKRNWFSRAVTLRGSMLIFALLVLVSLPIRLVDLQAPFTGEHEFRQTQTALSVWEIREHGFSLLHPRLPLFGPPWECPFEYPVFQTVAAIVDSIAPWDNLDVSIRLTNLLFFYLTAVALAILAQLLFRDAATPLFATAVFLFSPYNVHWSRSSMIEFAATFFGLAYLITFIRWTFSPGRMLFAACLALGILGCLTKATSFVIPLTIAGMLGLLSALPSVRAWLASRNVAASSGVPQLELRLGYMLSAALLLIVSLLAGFWYIHYGDLIKEQAPYTAWLSSRHPYIRNWTYGTWDQRLHLHNWMILWRRMQYTVMPSMTLAMILGWLALPFRLRQFKESTRENFWFGCSVVVAPLVAICFFFNLFVIHTYYMTACAPFLALFAGVGFSLIYNLTRTRVLQIALIALVAALELQEWSGQYGSMLQAPPSKDPRLVCLAEISRFIPKNDPVIVLSPSEWSGLAPYYLKRRAFMAMLRNKPVSIEPLLQQNYFKTNGFHWLLVEANSKDSAELGSKISAQWGSIRQIPCDASPEYYLLYALYDP